MTTHWLQTTLFSSYTHSILPIPIFSCSLLSKKHHFSLPFITQSDPFTYNLSPLLTIPLPYTFYKNQPLIFLFTHSFIMEEDTSMTSEVNNNNDQLAEQHASRKRPWESISDPLAISSTTNAPPKPPHKKKSKLKQVDPTTTTPSTSSKSASLLTIVSYLTYLY